MTETAPRILIAEDDGDIAATLERGLRADGYAPAVAADAAGALAAYPDAPPDAAIVDMMLGPDRGTDLVAALRARGMDGPILVLSALTGVGDRTDGLEAGADDYIAKPFEYGELLARLKVQEQRRARNADGPAPLVGQLRYDEGTRTVSNGTRAVMLTEREADLLQFLARRPNALCSRGDIFDALWHNDGRSSDNVVDVYIGYLRKKLAPLEDFGVALRTIRSRGFVLTEL